jgi:GSH-dependent disulfide-bond oxidoreductase
MLSVYCRPTCNGRKIPIVPEECGLSCNVIPMNINKGDRSTPRYAAGKPNNKMRALIDQDAPGGRLTSFEPGAIPQYLSEKTGWLLPADTAGRYRVLQWVYWPVGGLGPVAGQAQHFLRDDLEPRPCADCTSGP